MMNPAMAKMLGFKQTTIIYWEGELPKVGHWLMSTNRPRYAYRIVEIEAARPGLQHVAKAYLDRVPAKELPDGVTCHAWAWGPR